MCVVCCLLFVCVVCCCVLIVVCHLSCVVCRESLVLWCVLFHGCLHVV